MGLGFFSPRRIIIGMIISTFVIYPTLADPAGTFSAVAEFIGKLSPFFEGGV